MERDGWLNMPNTLLPIDASHLHTSVNVFVFRPARTVSASLATVSRRFSISPLSCILTHQFHVGYSHISAGNQPSKGAAFYHSSHNKQDTRQDTKQDTYQDTYQDTQQDARQYTKQDTKRDTK